MSQDQEKANSVQVLEAFCLSHPDIGHVALNYICYNNTYYTKMITIKRALAIARNPDEDGIANESDGPMAYRTDRTGFTSMEIIFNNISDKWVPDWSTIKCSAGHVDTAQVRVWLKSTDPKDRIGHEIEFCLLPSIDADEPIKTPGNWLNSTTVRHEGFKVVREAVKHLENNGIDVWVYHTNGNLVENGSYEISLSPSSPSKAADNLAYATSVIKDIANNHGYFATMHPAAFQEEPNLGQHIHFSIDQPKASQGDQFMAGVMDRLPQSTAFFLGGNDSYSTGRRIMYGGGYNFWCHGGPPDYGKLAPVRRLDEAYWELRMPDAMCSPHLQLAALILSGTEGIQKGLNLRVDPFHWRKVDLMTQEERGEKGIGKLPESLEDAVNELEKAKGWWQEKLSKASIDGYIENRRSEIQVSKTLSLKERRMKVFHSM